MRELSTEDDFDRGVSSGLAVLVAAHTGQLGGIEVEFVDDADVAKGRIGPRL